MRLLTVFSLALLLSFALPPRAGAGSVITVTTTADTLAEDGKCSLREAVIAANTDAPRGGCPAGNGADTIRFDPALPSPVAIRVKAGDFTENASLDGDYDFQGILTIEGRPDGHITLDAWNEIGTSLIDVLPGARITIRDVDLLRSGDKAGAAAKIASTGWLTMTRVSFANATTTAADALGRLTLSDSLIRDHGGIEVHGGQANLLRTNFLNAHAAIASYSGVLRLDYATFINSERIYISGGEAVLTNFTVDGGALEEGVANSFGRVALANCSIRGKQGYAGGVRNDGATAQMTIRNCRISGNTGVTRGGGILNGGALEVENTTIDGNSAPKGGGIFHEGASLKLTNVTISGNTATDNGGGLYAARETVLRYVTFAGNGAGGAGGDLFVDEAQVASAGSLFAAAAGQQSCAISAGHLVDSGGNLATDASCAGARIVVDAGLAPLADNGGFAPTHALLPGSPAVDAGASLYCPAADQRGATRPQGTTCDAGAYERTAALRSLYLPQIVR